MRKTKAKVTSWPRDRLDPTKRYRAVKDGLIYQLAPSREQPGYWHAAVKQGNRLLKRTERPLREDALLTLVRIGFFPWGMELRAV